MILNVSKSGSLGECDEFFSAGVFSVSEMVSGVTSMKHGLIHLSTLHSQYLNFILILLLWMKCKYIAAALLWLASFYYSIFQVRSSKEVRSKRFFLCVTYIQVLPPSPPFFWVNFCCVLIHVAAAHILSFPNQVFMSCVIGPVK